MTLCAATVAFEAGTVKDLREFYSKQRPLESMLWILINPPTIGSIDGLNEREIELYCERKKNMLAAEVSDYFDSKKLMTPHRLITHMRGLVVVKDHGAAIAFCQDFPSSIGKCVLMKAGELIMEKGFYSGDEEEDCLD